MEAMIAAVAGTQEPPTTRAPTDATRGLTTAEVEARRLSGEANEYRSPTSRSYVEIIRDNSYPLINGPLLLVSGALISFGAVTEALMTGIPVFGNIGIGVIQGSRAKRQLDRVALLSQAPATVVRDGVEHRVPPATVVMGDIVVANRGDEIQLDGRIVGEGRSSIDESALTGESVAVEKAFGDRVQSGSAVLSGVARYEVDAVGADTFANRILAQAKGRRDVRTPLQSDIAKAFVAVAVLIVLSALVVVLSFQATSTDPTHETVFAAAVLVTLVPQGLALMLAVTYAAAALRISRLGALAQRQSAIEAISRIDTFCTDKTGTLTTQRITFNAIVPLLVRGGAALDEAAIARVVSAMAASTNAPNTTTRALTAAFPGEALAVEQEIPFSSSQRWSAIRFDAGDAAHPAASGTFVLGAASVLTDAMSAEAGDEVRARTTALAATGRRGGAGSARADRVAHVRRRAAARGPAHDRGPSRAGDRGQDRVGRRPCHRAGDRSSPRIWRGHRRGVRPRPRRPRRRGIRGRSGTDHDLRSGRSAPQGTARRRAPAPRPLRGDDR
jgi:cation-transporting ATPase E